MIDRSMERLVALHADERDEGHGVLRSACARIHAFFRPYWRVAGAGPTADGGLDAVRALDEGRPGDAAAALFPAAPAIAGPRRHGSEDPLICRGVAPPLASPLHGP